MPSWSRVSKLADCEKPQKDGTSYHAMCPGRCYQPGLFLASRERLVVAMHNSKLSEGYGLNVQANTNISSLRDCGYGALNGGLYQLLTPTLKSNRINAATRTVELNSVSYGVMHPSSHEPCEE